jgi:hypothetical protein
MAIAGHVSPKMLAHYSHVRLDAKHRALDALSSGSLTGGMAQSATQTPLCRRYPVRKLLRKMVGPCGLEPQTSTVSIWWPHDYGLLLKATKCRCVKKMRSLWCFHHNRSYVVNFGDKTRSVLNSVFNSICKRFGGRDRDRTADPLLAKIARTKNQ